MPRKFPVAVSLIITSLEQHQHHKCNTTPEQPSHPRFSIDACPPDFSLAEAQFANTQHYQLGHTSSPLPQGPCSKLRYLLVSGVNAVMVMPTSVIHTVVCNLRIQLVPAISEQTGGISRRFGQRTGSKCAANTKWKFETHSRDDHQEFWCCS